MRFLRPIDFIRYMVGFKLEHQQGEAFAKVSLDGLSIFLSGGGSSGARPMPGGRRQEPGAAVRSVSAQILSSQSEQGGSITVQSSQPRFFSPYESDT